MKKDSAFTVHCSQGISWLEGENENRLNHKDLFTYIEAASEKERMVHVAVEESVAFYEVWAFEIES